MVWVSKLFLCSKISRILINLCFLYYVYFKIFWQGKWYRVKDCRSISKIELSNTKQLILSLICLIVFVLFFVYLFTQLIIWHLSDPNLNLLDNRYLLLNSIIIGVCASLFTILFAIALSLSYRNFKKLRLFISISSSGYAIPGSVISAALLIGFYTLFGSSITLYGIYGLILCLSLRFMTPAFNYVLSSLSNISQSAENALATQPKNPYKAFSSFYLPQMKPAIFLSIMVVFIECIKEQPATLLLRPVGFDTLSTKIYNYTSEGQWEMAASPSLLFVMISLIFLYI